MGDEAFEYVSVNHSPQTHGDLLVKTFHELRASAEALREG
jgi:hypothetical protein